MTSKVDSEAPEPATSSAPSWWLAVVLATAVLAISSAAILVRGITEAHPLAIAFYRCMIAGMLFIPGLRRMSFRDIGLTVFAGACLAVHFATWFASIHQTTVMHATVLVCLSPVWVGVIESLSPKHRPSPRFWAGIAIAIPASAWMVTDTSGQVTLAGDLLAFIGGIAGGIYFAIGRRVRERVSIGAYACSVCFSAAFFLGGTAIVTSAPMWGFPWTEGLFILACVLGPQMLGHNGFNYALRYLPASLVSALLLLEPVGATVLAALIYTEVPTLTGALASSVVVAGVLTSIRSSADG